MKKKVNTCGILVMILGLSIFSNAFAWEYSNRQSGNYTYHNFVFNRAEIIEMSKSPYSSQKYANAAVDKIWILAKGMGSNLARLTGQAKLAFSLNSMAKKALRQGENEMGVQIRSRRDEGGKWALEFMDKVADVWKKLAGK